MVLSGKLTFLSDSTFPAGAFWTFAIAFASISNARFFIPVLLWSSEVYPLSINVFTWKADQVSQVDLTNASF